MNDLEKSRAQLKIWDMLNGKYPKRITQELTETMSHTLKNITKLDDKTLEELDILRNQLFLESVLQDNNCLKSISYDISEAIHQKNIGILQDVADHLGRLQAGSLLCLNNTVSNDHTVIEKMEWHKLFRTKTKNFTDLNGWKTPTPKNE